jgi:hypothetical protein
MDRAGDVNVQPPSLAGVVVLSVDQNVYLFWLCMPYTVEGHCFM